MMMMMMIMMIMMCMLLLKTFIYQQADDLEVMAFILRIPYYFHHHKSAVQDRLNIDTRPWGWTLQ